MENKSGVGIEDHWMKSMMEPACTAANTVTVTVIEKSVSDNRSSVKREKAAECFNGSTEVPVTYVEMKVQQQNNPSRYQCDICDLTFPEMEYLILHKKFHMNDREVVQETSSVSEALMPQRDNLPKKRRKFKCDQCDVKVNSQYHLDIHHSKHEGSASKKYICDICERTFVAAQFLKSHMMTHSNTSTINCEICNKSFTGQAYLKLHMQLHNDVKKFKCSKCDEIFATKNCLKIHMKKHSKVKNFKCDYCGKQFVSKITMEKHRTSHEGRPIDCNVKCGHCDRTLHASLLRTHMQRAHHNDDDVKRPHKCTTCGKSFIMKINLNLHIRVCHPNLAEQEDEEEDSGED